jgi:integrase
MARYREPFTLYYRKKQDGAKVWYWRTYDEYGDRTPGCSTGLTSKTLATRYCMELYRQGRLVPSADPLFRDYAVPWWIWQTCAYVRGRRERSPEGRPTISERHVVDMRRILEAYLLPAFGTKRLSAITPKTAERWMFELRDRGLSAKRVNNIMGCLRVMLNEAVRLGQLHLNPMDRVRPLAGGVAERKLLSLEEVRKLFAAEAIEKVWGGHLLYRALNLTAAATGCRLGELLALQDADVHDEGYFHIVHSWHARYGLLPTKTRQERDVPVPARALEAIELFRGSGGFVFSMNRGKRPIGNSNATRALHAALETIGIPAQEQVRRHLSFHAWRHWFNSAVRARGVPLAVLQRAIGHTSASMSERYTTFSLEHFAPVVKAQAELFPEQEATGG